VRGTHNRTRPALWRTPFLAPTNTKVSNRKCSHEEMHLLFLEVIQLTTKWPVGTPGATKERGYD